MSATEIVDETAGVVLRRVVVGPLRTNCWIVHPYGSLSAVVVDPGDEPERVLAATAGLDDAAVVLTHSHWDHVLAVPALIEIWGLEPWMHPADKPVWPHELEYLARHGHFDAGTATAQLLEAGHSLTTSQPLWNGAFVPMGDGDTIRLDRLDIRVLHTPGHTPGGVSLLVGGRHLLTGDTLFPGGPGLTGWPLADFPTIVASIERRLLPLPGATAVHPGHGPSTTIAAERPALPAWIARGW